MKKLYAVLLALIVLGGCATSKPADTGEEIYINCQKVWFDCYERSEAACRNKGYEIIEKIDETGSPKSLIIKCKS